MSAKRQDGVVGQDQPSITIRVRRVLHAVFPAKLWQRVEHALIIDCGPVQVHSPAIDVEAMERIWLAALKKSKGDIAAFEDAVLLAQIDWRDLLVSAGFGSDMAAHLRWADKIAGRPAL